MLNTGFWCKRLCAKSQGCMLLQETTIQVAQVMQAEDEHGRFIETYMTTETVLQAEIVSWCIDKRLLGQQWSESWLTFCTMLMVP